MQRPVYDSQSIVLNRGLRRRLTLNGRQRQHQVAQVVPPPHRDIWNGREISAGASTADTTGSAYDRLVVGNDDAQPGCRWHIVGLEHPCRGLIQAFVDARRLLRSRCTSIA